MTNVQTQIAEFNQSALQAAISFFNLSVQNVERIVNLNLESAKTAMEGSVEHAKALTEVKDVQELATLRTRATEASTEKALAYSRSLYELANQAQAQVAQLVEQQFNTFNQKVVSVVETAARNAPAGGELAVVAVNASVDNTNAAVDSFKRVASEASRITDNAVENAQQAAETVFKGGKRRN